MAEIVRLCQEHEQKEPGATLYVVGAYSIGKEVGAVVWKMGRWSRWKGQLKK